MSPITQIKLCFYVVFHRLIQKKAGCVIYCKLYLLQAKAKWQANDGKLSYDFTDRLFKTAHSPQVTKIIEQSPEFKELDKEFVSPCNNCGNHLDMKIKMKSPTRMTNFNTYTKETSQCRKLSAGEKTKEVKLIEKLVKEKGSI